MVEFLDRILPGMDGEVGQAVPAHPREAGHRIQARRRRSPAVDATGNGATRHGRAGRRRRRRRRSRPTWCSSRSAACPTPRASASSDVGVQTRRQGPRRRSTTHFATNVPGIYAIGDVIAGPDAGPQGRGRGRRRGRDHRRPGRPRELRRHPERRLHLSGDRLGRQDRGGAEGGRASPTRSASSRSPPTAAPRSTARPTAS